jgi:hypothetical protein
MSYSRQDIIDASKQILSDPELREEILKYAAAKDKPVWIPNAAKGLRRLAKLPDSEEGLRTEAVGAPDFELESIAQRVGRPVLAVAQGNIDLNISAPDSLVWKNRLQKSAAVLSSAIAAVGRVEATNSPLALPYVGTGWLIDENIIVTNRHVALKFAEKGQRGFTFQLGFDRRTPIGVDIDFLEEINNPAQAQFNIENILFIAPDTGPDVAFLKLRPERLGRLAQPLKLSKQVLPEKTMVAVIGYPGRDPFIPDQQLMAQIFGDVFDKKRIAPGFVTGLENNSLTHDCTTLGGNSGSAVIDMLTGDAAALHFAGVFLKKNYAVPSPVVSILLARAREAETLTVSAPEVGVSNFAGSNKPNMSGDTMSGDRATIVIPLEITICRNPIGCVDLTISQREHVDFGAKLLICRTCAYTRCHRPSCGPSSKSAVGSRRRHLDKCRVSGGRRVDH